MTRQAMGVERGLRATGLALLLLGTAGAGAHGERASAGPFVEGCRAVLAEPCCLMVLLAGAGLLAQPGQPGLKTALQAALAGLAAGTLLAAAGVAIDLTLPLLGLALAMGALVACARPLPVALQAVLAAVAATGLVLMSAPGASPATGSALGPHLAGLVGAVTTVVLISVNAFALIRTLLGRHPGVVKRMLLRVAGSWSAAAALLVLVLEMGRRST